MAGGCQPLVRRRRGRPRTRFPLAAIARIEVLRDGASAIYGTDAIGGVINFILRRDYQGFEAERRRRMQPQAIRRRRDQPGRALPAASGSLTENRFNVMGSLDMRKQKVLEAEDRLLRRDRHPVRRRRLRHQRHQLPGRPQRLRAVAAELQPADVRFPNPAGTACRYDFTRDIDIIPENEQLTALMRGSFAITPDHTPRSSFCTPRSRAPKESRRRRTATSMPAEQPILPRRCAGDEVIPDSTPGGPTARRHRQLPPGSGRQAHQRSDGHQPARPGRAAGRTWPVWDYRTRSASPRTRPKRP